VRGEDGLPGNGPDIFVASRICYNGENAPHGADTIFNKGGAMRVVLVQPEIPGNTGNIARLCAASGCSLHLVRPLGFSTQDRYLKRAGLDYWHLVDIHYHESVFEVIGAYPADNFHLFTTKAEKKYSDAAYQADDLLVFGRETAGLPAELLEKHPGHCVRIPMKNPARSLNLANSVAVAVYEALRQTGYEGFL
jgi:tRNA (cytidine/uridine-2'-O-)-methyltransferase